MRKRIILIAALATLLLAASTATARIQTITRFNLYCTKGQSGYVLVRALVPGSYYIQGEYFNATTLQPVPSITVLVANVTVPGQYIAGLVAGKPGILIRGVKWYGPGAVLLTTKFCS